MASSSSSSDSGSSSKKPLGKMAGEWGKHLILLWLPARILRVLRRGCDPNKGRLQRGPGELGVTYSPCSSLEALCMVFSTASMVLPVFY